jgi:hypothetical protein
LVSQIAIKFVRSRSSTKATHPVTQKPYATARHLQVRMWIPAAFIHPVPSLGVLIACQKVRWTCGRRP